MSSIYDDHASISQSTDQSASPVLKSKLLSAGVPEAIINEVLRQQQQKNCRIKESSPSHSSLDPSYHVRSQTPKASPRSLGETASRSTQYSSGHSQSPRKIGVSARRYDSLSPREERKNDAFLFQQRDCDEKDTSLTSHIGNTSYIQGEKNVDASHYSLDKAMNQSTPSMLDIDTNYARVDTTLRRDNFSRGMDLRRSVSSHSSDGVIVTPKIRDNGGAFLSSKSAISPIVDAGNEHLTYNEVMEKHDIVVPFTSSPALLDTLPQLQSSDKDTVVLKDKETKSNNPDTKKAMESKENNEMSEYNQFFTETQSVQPSDSRGTFFSNSQTYTIDENTVDHTEYSIQYEESLHFLDCCCIGTFNSPSKSSSTDTFRNKPKSSSVHTISSCATSTSAGSTVPTLSSSYSETSLSNSSSVTEHSYRNKDDLLLMDSTVETDKKKDQTKFKNSNLLGHDSPDAKEGFEVVRNEGLVIDEEGNRKIIYKSENIRATANNIELSRDAASFKSGASFKSEASKISECTNPRLAQMLNKYFPESQDNSFEI